MECISCKVEINPQWSHAIDINVCPFCGKHIMDEHLKNLFGTLRETMDALQTYPEQLNDWMLSNHNYVKTDSEKLLNYVPKEMLTDLKKIKDDKDFQERKKFTVKVKTETGVEEVQAESLQSE
jgi:Zn-finger nucleic acid-binding protein